MNPLSGRTILIADDERYITTTIALKLRQAGATVLVANDGQEAFALATANTPQLVVSDFQMPIMSGLDLARQLKATAQTSEIPVLMLTARGHKLSPTELSQTNIRTLLAKPFSARELLLKLEELATSLPAIEEEPGANAA